MPRWKKDKAREMRRYMTKAEHTLWIAIRKKQTGYKFRAQVPLYGYIADFMCPAKKLVIEVDGGYHDERIAADKDRDTNLSNYGYMTIRFKNEEVMTNLPIVIDKIYKTLHPKKCEITTKWSHAPRVKFIKPIRKPSKRVKQSNLFHKLLSLEEALRNSKSV